MNEFSIMNVDDASGFIAVERSTCLGGRNKAGSIVYNSGLRVTHGLFSRLFEARLLELEEGKHLAPSKTEDSLALSETMRRHSFGLRR